jgi:hypothetical protein
MDPKLRTEKGPFTAEMLRPGDRYELERGHAYYVAPSGGEHGRTLGIGYSVLASDPLVDEAGIDVGYVTGPGSLCTPDIAIGNVPDKPGWVAGAPHLAVEYASIGQGEGELARRIRQLLAAGTQFVWLVRLRVPRHVEVHTVGAPARIMIPGDHLSAPGILANPVPVEALWDGRRAAEITLRNLLSRQGYETLEEVRRDSFEEGREEP